MFESEVSIKPWSHITLSVDIYWIKKSMWHGQEEKSWLYKSKKSIVIGSRQSCSSQDHVETLKLWQRWESDKKKNQVDKLKFILKCFISFLSIGHRIIKRDATWWSWQNQIAQNLERFQEWAKETKFQECAEICPTGQTGIAHWSGRLTLSDPFTRFQRYLPDLSGLRPD
jgi:hypothetical protein